MPSLERTLRKKGHWIVRVERKSCPFCLQSKPAWEEVARTCPTRARVLPRERLPGAVTSVRTVPRYLIVQKDGKVLLAFGDSKTTGAQILAEAERTLQV